MNDENEEYEQTEVAEHPLYPGGLPTWRFSLWDVAGVGVSLIAGVFAQTGHTLSILSREFQAAANFERARKTEQEEWDFYETRQRALARELEGVVGFAAFEEGGGEQ